MEGLREGGAEVWSNLIGRASCAGNLVELVTVFSKTLTEVTDLLPSSSFFSFLVALSESVSKSITDTFNDVDNTCGAGDGRSDKPFMPFVTLGFRYGFDPFKVWVPLGADALLF